MSYINVKGMVLSCSRKTKSFFSLSQVESLLLVVEKMSLKQSCLA